MKLVWLTDIHLNFLEDEQLVEFYQKMASSECDGLLISGDIAEASCIEGFLHDMSIHIKKPIFFVLGNHDYYHGNVSTVRESVTKLTKTNPLIKWLPAAGVQQLDHETILVGQDGWADGRIGDYQNSPVEMNDSKLIEDLHKESGEKSKLLRKMQQLADIDAANLENDVRQAIIRNPRTIMILTHVPPFRETCRYKGEISDDNYQPFFSSKAMGDVLLKMARTNPHINFEVYCGHTHCDAQFSPLPNLQVKAGKATYGKPEPQQVIKLGHAELEGACAPGMRPNQSK